MKRLISIILALIIIVGIIPVSALATDSEAEIPTDIVETDTPLTDQAAEFRSPVCETTDITYIPTDPEVSTFSVSAAANYSTDVSSAAAVLRDGMKSRNDLIIVNYKLDASTVDGTDTALINLGNTISEQALMHTGVPTEGDSLHWVVGSIQQVISYTLTGGYYFLDIAYNVTYYTTVAQEAELTNAVTDVVSQLRLKDNISDYQKICNIYNFICDTVSYDFSHLNNPEYTLQFTAYAALINKTAVCQGYATLFYRLALEAGIDARVIAGTSFNGSNWERHSWNIVKLDNKYYLLDSTWDAGTYEYSYFLKSQADFPDHYPDPEYETDAFVSSYPIAASSYVHSGDGTYTEGNFEYTVSNGNAILTKYKGTDKNVVIPAILGGYPVYRIASQAISYNSTMETLTLSEGICVIESESIFSCTALRTLYLPSTLQLTSYDSDGAMSGLSSIPLECIALEKIIVAEGNPDITVYDGALYTKDMKTLLMFPNADPRKVFEVPDGVLMIGSDAFSYNSNLKKVILPDTVETIGYWSFNNCYNLKTINIPNNCEFIGQYAFSGTSLTSIHIPAATTIIVSGAFSFTPDLKTITVDPANPVFSATDNVLYANFEFGSELRKYPSLSQNTGYIIPDDVYYIEWYAFTDVENLRQLVIPASVGGIGNSAFFDTQRYGENLEIIFLGDAPVFEDNSIFANNTVTIYYPKNNNTWSSHILQDYAGSLTWISGLPTRWIKSGNSWYYLNGDNGLAEGWQKIDGKWYFFNEEGIMQTGWNQIEGKWYYFNTGGSMATGWQLIGNNWYYLNKGGSMATGWLSLGGKWYYMRPSGTMVTGWYQVGSKWYYFNTSGVMQTGWLQSGGKWYYLSSGGSMAVSWQQIGGYWYYFNSSGIMQTGWKALGGKWYYFKSGGTMATGWLQDGRYRYYLNESGAMLTGTHTINGTTYTFNKSGVLIA